jgi:hypothetical protein
MKLIKRRDIKIVPSWRYVLAWTITFKVRKNPCTTFGPIVTDRTFTTGF